MAFEMLTVFRADLSDLDSKAALAKTITQQTAQSMTGSLENVGQGFKSLSVGMDSIAKSGAAPAMKEIAGAASAAGSGVSDLAIKQAQLLGHLNSVQTALHGEVKTLSDAQAAVLQYGTGHAALNTVLSDSEKKVASYIAQQSLLKGELKSVEAALRPIPAALIPTVSGFTKLGEEVRHFASGIAEVPGPIHGIIAALGGLTIAGAGATLLIAGLGFAAIEAGQEINAAWRILEVQTGAVGASLEGLKSDFAAVFVNVPSSAKEVAEAIAQIHIRTGEAGTALQELATKEIELAHITGAQLAPQIDATSKLFAQWGPQIKSPSDALDTLFKISQKTGIGVTQLAGELNKAGPVMRSFGISFEQGAAMIAQLDKEGLDSQKIIAGMSIAFRKLVGDLHGDVLGAFDGLVKKMQDAKTTAEANTLAVQYFGRGAATMGEAVRSGKLDIEGLTESLKSAGPGIEEVALKTRTLGESFEIAKNGIILMLAPLGQELIRALKDALGSIQGFVHDNEAEIKTGLNNIAQAVRDWGPVLGNVVAAVGDILTFQWGKVLERLALATADALRNLAKETKNRLEEIKDAFGLNMGSYEDVIRRAREAANKPAGRSQLLEGPLKFEAPLLKINRPEDVLNLKAFMDAGNAAGKAVGDAVKTGAREIPDHLKKHGQTGAKAFIDGFTEGAAGLSKAVELIAGQSTAQLEHLMDPLSKGAKKNLAETQAALKAETTGINEYLSSVGISAKLSEAQLAGMGKSTRDELGASSVAWKNNQEVVNLWAIELLRSTGVTLPQVNEYLKSIGATTDISGKQLMDFSQTNQELFKTLISGTHTFEDHKKAVADLNVEYELQWAALDRLHPPITTFTGDMNIASESAKQVEAASNEWVATLDKLPPSLLSVAQASVKAAHDTQAEWAANTQTLFEFGKQMGYTGDALTKFAHDGIASVQGFGAAGEKAFSDFMKAQAQVSFDALSKKVNAAVNGITEIFTLIPGKFGDMAKQIEKTVNTIDKILKNLHAVFNDIPANLGEVIAKVVNLFKGMASGVGQSLSGVSASATQAAKDFSSTSDNLLDNLGKASQGAADIGTKAGTSFSKGFLGKLGLITSGIATFFATRSTTGAATPTSIIGATLAGAQIGAAFGGGFGAAVGAAIGAAVGGWKSSNAIVRFFTGGIFSAIFGGPSDADKAKIAQATEQQKIDFQNSAQAVVSNALDAFSKGLDFLNQLDDFTRVRKAKFRDFFANLTRLMDYFVELSKNWSQDSLAAAKAFAESISPIVTAIGDAVKGLDALSAYSGVPGRAIAQFGTDLARSLSSFAAVAEMFAEDKPLVKQARKFAERITDVISLIGSAVLAFMGTKDSPGLSAYSGIPAQVFDLFAADLQLAVQKMGVIAESIDAGMVKEAQRFADKVQSVFSLISGAMQAFLGGDKQPGLAQYAKIPIEVFDAFFADLVIATNKMAAVTALIDTTMLAQSQAFAEKTTPIFTAIKAAVEALATLKDYTRIPAETFQALLDNFTQAINTMLAGIVVSERFVDISKTFEANIISGAAHLANAVAIFTAAIRNLGFGLAMFGVTVSLPIPDDSGVGTTATSGGVGATSASSSGGGFAPSFASGGASGFGPSAPLRSNTTVHQQVNVTLDVSKFRDIKHMYEWLEENGEDLVEMIEQRFSMPARLAQG